MPRAGVRWGLPFASLGVLLVGTLVAMGLGLAQAPAAAHPAAAVASLAPGPAQTTSATSARTTAPPSPAPPSARTLAAALVAGRVVVPLTLGGLTIDPAPASGPGAPLGLDQAEASAYVGDTSGVGAPPRAGSTPTVGFGLVTLRGVAAPGGTPPLQDTPAWVGIVLGVNRGAFSCPAHLAAPADHRPPATTEPFRPEDRVVIFYAQGGRGAVLYDTGGSAPCGGSPVPPSLTEAQALVAVPWHQEGPAGRVTTVTYQAPQCARLASVGAGGNVRTGVFHVEVDVTFPFARTGCDGVRTFSASVTVFPNPTALPPHVGPPVPAPREVTLVPSTAPAGVPPALVGPLAS